MRVVPTDLPGVLVIEPDVHRDAPRLLPRDLPRRAVPRRAASTARSSRTTTRDRSRGTLRGLHLQVRSPQGKLVRVIEGEIFDVAVDVRRGSPTFGRWVGVTLSAENFRQSTSRPASPTASACCQRRGAGRVQVHRLYDPRDEIGIAWNDPALAIAWPVVEPLLSAARQAASDPGRT